MMAEVKLLREAVIRNDDGQIVMDFTARGLIAAKIMLDLDDGRHIEWFEPLPTDGPDWVPRLLATVIKDAATRIMDAE